MGTILIVEDDRFIRDLVATKLQQERFEVASVDNGEGALEAIRNDCPTLVILDLELKGMQGIEVLRSLHEEERLSQCPLLIFSNCEDDDIKDECLQLGITDFFVKVNTDLNALVARVRYLIEEHQQESHTA